MHTREELLKLIQDLVEEINSPNSTQDHSSLICELLNYNEQLERLQKKS